MDRRNNNEYRAEIIVEGKQLIKPVRTVEFNSSEQSVSHESENARLSNNGLNDCISLTIRQS